jgi:signal transduction histidine kinase
MYQQDRVWQLWLYQSLKAFAGRARMIGWHHMHAQTPKRSRSRGALFAGFGALLILMAIICIDSLHTLEAFETRNAQIRQDFLYRERTLDELRARLYESRDTLLDYVLIKSEPQQREALRAELHAIQDETKEKLQQCIQSLPTAKRQPFERLNVELTKYWATIESSVAPHLEKGKEPGNLVSRSDVLSQHAAVLALAKEVSALNDAELKEAERAITQAFAEFRRRFVIVATMTLSFALILATTTIVYAGRLEKNVEQKYHESLQAQRELKELSKRLVDAEERERRAISRELHDEVGQSLSALLLEVENLASSEGGLFRPGLQNIKTLAENGVNEVRNMALLLRPSMLDDLGLVAALEWQAREVSRRTGMLVETVDENVSETLPDEHKTCVYRIVQEALNNCSRHAYAKNVRVVVRQEPNQLRVSIEDDGKGFDSRRRRGLGLVGMNERVSQLGGVLTVDSDPTRGTRLRVELPLPNSSTDLEKFSR